MKIAIFADLHYTCEADRLKSTILDWALSDARMQGADAIICAGDMIGNGTLAEAAALISKLEHSGLPVAYTPGNAELRTPADAAEVCRNFRMHSRMPVTEQGAGLIVLEDTSLCYCSADVFRRLPDGAGVLFVTHCPPWQFGDEVLSAWQEAIQRGAVALTVAGHVHEDVKCGNSGIAIRGLDPDKTIGGPPSYVIADNSSGVWRQTAVREMPGIRPEEWSAEFRQAFLRDLGISGMNDPLENLQFAISHKIPCYEFHYVPDANQADWEQLLSDWRAAGGRCLSIHLPVISAAEIEKSTASLNSACCRAVSLGADRVTLHVPDVPVGDFKAKEAILLRAFEEGLAPLKDTGIVIGVENMHTKRGNTRENRGFGFTPPECRYLMAALSRMPGLTVGYHCDIGHARNNAPYDWEYPLSAWYELLGAKCCGMHLHQVLRTATGDLENHGPLTGFFTPLISLGSLILARQSGLLAATPMFLEIRAGKVQESYLAIRKMIENY